MVERRPTLGILAHVVLLLGVLIVAFPLYVTFVASTQTADEILQAPMSLVPGSHLVENYLAALKGTGMGAASNAPVGRMMMVSLITALVIALALASIQAQLVQAGSVPSGPTGAWTCPENVESTN